MKPTTINFKEVKNNPDKFPSGYVFHLTNNEFDFLRSKFLTTKFRKTRVPEPQVTDSETTIELNLAVLKLKHTVKRKKE